MIATVWPVTAMTGRLGMTRKAQEMRLMKNLVPPRRE
jgi:hypothetical protein